MLTTNERRQDRLTLFMTATHSPAQLAALNALKFDLQVKSELNDPAIRRQFKEGNGIDNKSRRLCDRLTYK